MYHYTVFSSVIEIAFGPFFVSVTFVLECGSIDIAVGVSQRNPYLHFDRVVGPKVNDNTPNKNKLFCNIPLQYL